MEYKVKQKGKSLREICNYQALFRGRVLFSVDLRTRYQSVIILLLDMI